MSKVDVWHKYCSDIRLTSSDSAPDTCTHKQRDILAPGEDAAPAETAGKMPGQAPNLGHSVWVTVGGGEGEWE